MKEIENTPIPIARLGDYITWHLEYFTTGSAVLGIFENEGEIIYRVEPRKSNTDFMYNGSFDLVSHRMILGVLRRYRSPSD